MDGYNRKILSWGLFENMERLTSEIILMKARKLYPDMHPRIITDNGSQFIPKDFRDLVNLLEIEQTFTSPAHPQSNRKLERFHRTFKRLFSSPLSSSCLYPIIAALYFNLF
jgi:transposase InsO family protein